jgi:hypothetical protein
MSAEIIIDEVYLNCEKYTKINIINATKETK